MPRIRCHYLDCAFLDENYCTAASVELDPDDGCKTFTENADISSDEELIDEQEDEELEDWDETDEEDEGDEDFWPDDE